MCTRVAADRSFWGLLHTCPPLGSFSCGGLINLTPPGLRREPSKGKRLIPESTGPKSWV